MKILAVADTHVDDAIALGGLRPTGESGRPVVLEQAERTMRWIAEVAEREQVDLIIHAGDVYERPRPSPASEAVVVNALIDWAEIAPVIVLCGNHDRPRGRGVTALEPLKNLAPGRLHISERPEQLFVAGGFVSTEPPSRTSHLSVCTLPYPDRSALAKDCASPEEANQRLSEGLQSILQAFASLASASPHHTVLALHGTLRGSQFSEYQVAPLSDVQVPTQGIWDAFDVQIAGHIHLRQDAPGTGGEYGYVGSPDQMSFGEEGETKGLDIFEVDDSGVERTFVANPHQRWFKTLRAEGADRLVAPFEQLDPLPHHPTKFTGVERMVTDLAEDADHARRYIYRAKGLVEREHFAEIVQEVRALRSVGFLIKNACEIKRNDRARVTLDPETTQIDLAAALELVFEARPDLGATADEIRACVAELGA